MESGSTKKRKQVLCWLLLNRLFSSDDSPNMEPMGAGILNELGLPDILLDRSISIDNLLQRYPELKSEVAALRAQRTGVDDDMASLRNTAIYTKMLYNVFAMPGDVTAQQYNDWCADVGRLEEAFGYEPGVLRGKRSGGVQVGDEELARGLKAMEGDLIKRMRLREILKDDRLAARLAPSMPLVEQLLRDKSNLSGTALKNAKKLIRTYIDQVAEVLRTEVEKATVGELDRSVPPKRVFANLDLKRTIWKNLINWNPDENRLYVDRLWYHRTSRKQLPSKLIVVVDQSGSMVDSMVNCTILASIFAGLPNVDPHLIAYDTRAADLSPWVADPFEVLLRTNLGGGTDGVVALPFVRDKITDPRRAVLVWISDFFDFNSTMLFNQLKALKDTGVKLIPVGSVTSSGHQSVDSWFRKRFKELGCPVISGSIKKLIFELKRYLKT